MNLPLYEWKPFGVGGHVFKLFKELVEVCEKLLLHLSLCIFLECFLFLS